MFLYSISRTPRQKSRIVVDGYILNRLHGKVDKYEDVKDDMDIMERITYEDIEPHLKNRR